MKLLSRTLTALVLVFGLGFSAYAQEDTPNSNYNKYEAFSPLFMNSQANSFHSATGNPGPDYWQNQADYQIKATIDTASHKITGEVTITYTNNSPYPLHFVWLQLDQNTFKKSSRSSALYPASDRNGIRNHTTGYHLNNITVDGDKADYLINDTRLKINLPEVLKPNGKKVDLHIGFAFTIPEHGKDRMGRLETENGTIYTLAQWYPRMAVYDEVEGWNTLPYLGTGEFYLEYGDFDYEITAPDNMLVVGSGILQNPKKVLTDTQRNRLDKARQSDETVTILSEEEMENGNAHVSSDNGMLTWHFEIENARDVAWAASSAFIWDAARINLPNEKTALAQSVYPVESAGQDGYGRSTEYVKHAIEITSKWYPYPYKMATNVAGHEGGMEYPSIVFCSYKSKNSSLWNVINHEFGHTWFPMIVGSNERRYAWMDEGLNTFINDVTTKQFNNGEYYQEQDLQKKGAMVFNESLDPIFTIPDVIHNQYNLAIEAYYKPAIGLKVLRQAILGPKRFDKAFKTYINRWAYKHPQPWDFFNTMGNVSGEDLGWFFKGWYLNEWTIDQGVKDIAYVDGDYTKGAEITLLNKGKLPMPTTLKITFKDNSSKVVELPVEIWVTGSEYVYHLDSKAKIAAVEVDPEHLVPDENPGNNLLKNLDQAPEGVTAKTVISSYLKAIGGRENLENISDFTKKMKTTVQGVPVSITIKVKTPDSYLRDITVFGQSTMKTIINNGKVTLFVRGEEKTLSAEQEKQFLNLKGHIFPELNFSKDGYHINLLGVDEIDGKPVYVVQVETPAGTSSKLYYGVESGLKVKLVSTNGTASTLSDYREVDGIKIPFKASADMLGRHLKMTIEEVKINTGLKDSIFE